MLGVYILLSSSYSHCLLIHADILLNIYLPVSWLYIFQKWLGQRRMLESLTSSNLNSKQEVFIYVFFFNSKAVAPLLQGDVLILVGVTLLKEAGYAVLHGHQRCS